MPWLGRLRLERTGWPGRRTRWLVGTATLLALTLLLLLVLFPDILRKELNPAGFEQIRQGMTLADVERLMGGPPGSYGGHPGGGTFGTGPGTYYPHEVPGATSVFMWFDDHNMYGVWFDSNDRTLEKRKAHHALIPLRESWFGRLRRRLGL